MVPALGLGAEPPEEGVMDLPPRKLSDHLITKELLTRAYLVLGPVQSVVAMLAFYFYYWTNGHAGQWLDLPDTGNLYLAATAIALSAVVMTQIGNVLAQRAGHRSILKLPLFSNKLVWIGIVTEVLLAFGIVYLPFLQKFIGTSAFNLKYWLFLALFIPALPITDAIFKAFKRRRRTIVTQTH